MIGVEWNLSTEQVPAGSCAESVSWPLPISVISSRVVNTTRLQCFVRVVRLSGDGELWPLRVWSLFDPSRDVLTYRNVTVAAPASAPSPPAARTLSINQSINRYMSLASPTITTRTTTRSCRTRKRAFHFYSPGVVRRSHAAALHVWAVFYGPLLLILH